MIAVQDLLGLFVPPVAGGGATLVQSAIGTSTVGTGSLTVSISPTVQHDFLIAIAGCTNVGAISSVQASDGSLFTVTVVENPNGGILAIYFLADCAAGITSVTLTPGSFSGCSLKIAEFSGPLLTGAFDQSHTATTGFSPAGTTFNSGNTPTLSNTGELIIGAAYSWRIPSQTFSAGSGFSALGADDGQLFSEYIANDASTTALAATGSFSVNASNEVYSIVVTFKTAASTGPSATAAGVATVSGTLTGAGALSGSAAGVGSSSSVLVGAGTLSANLAGVAAISATSIGAGALNATLAGVGSQSGTLSNLAGGPSATAAGVGAITATLSGSGAFAATAAGVGASTASLAGAGTLAATSAGVASSTAALQGAGAFAATAAGVASSTAAINGVGLLASSSAGVGAGTANILGAGLLSASSNGVASSTAALFGAGAIFSVLPGSATVSGTLQALSPNTTVFVFSRLKGVASGTAQLTDAVNIIIANCFATPAINVSLTVQPAINVDSFALPAINVTLEVLHS